MTGPEPAAAGQAPAAAAEPMAAAAPEGEQAAPAEQVSPLEAARESMLSVEAGWVAGTHDALRGSEERREAWRALVQRAAGPQVCASLARATAAAS